MNRHVQSFFVGILEEPGVFDEKLPLIKHGDDSRVVGRFFHGAKFSDHICIGTSLRECRSGEQMIDAPANISRQRARYTIIPEGELSGKRAVFPEYVY